MRNQLWRKSYQSWGDADDSHGDDRYDDNHDDNHVNHKVMPIDSHGDDRHDDNDDDNHVNHKVMPIDSHGYDRHDDNDDDNDDDVTFLSEQPSFTSSIRDGIQRKSKKSQRSSYAGNCRMRHDSGQKNIAESRYNAPAFNENRGITNSFSGPWI